MYSTIVIGCTCALLYLFYIFIFEFTIIHFGIYIVTYLFVTEVAIQMRWMHWPWVRSSLFVKLVNRYIVNIDFDDAAVELLKRLDTDPQLLKKSKIFAVEPHGRSTTVLTMLFAANGSLKLLYSITLQNTAVVAFVLIKFVPFIRELLAVYGVLDSTKSSIRRYFTSNNNNNTNDAGDITMNTETSKDKKIDSASKCGKSLWE